MALAMSSQEVHSTLQLPPGRLPSHVVEFDTLQIVNDIRIPYGRYGKGSTLEPIANTFPEFGGRGGATQAITDQPIVIRRLWELKK